MVLPQPGTGSTSYFSTSQRQQIGSSWSGCEFTAGNADGNADGTAHGDLLDAKNSTGELFFYPQGCCKTTIGTGGWTSFRLFISDFNHDGRGDVLTIDTTGNFWYYPTTTATASAHADKWPTIGPRQHWLLTFVRARACSRRFGAVLCRF